MVMTKGRRWKGEREWGDGNDEGDEGKGNGKMVIPKGRWKGGKKVNNEGNGNR